MPESLALKHRPRTFGDLVGQKAIQVILRQMVLRDAVPQVLLLNGSRGTGKTTTARILAAALNCEVPPEPCGHCPSCKAIFDGTSLDVLEIDAASNGLVDDIRQLRSQVMYSVGGRHRVIILDEVHSMSPAAFNATLKMFEEPILDTVFVLLTTEPRCIPETVMSRCMPFTFRRIGIADMVERLTYICEQEALDVEPALLHLIAERADGGMRDAIMTLDQYTCIGVTTVEQFTKLTGETDFAPELLNALAAGNLPAAFVCVNEVMAHTGDTSTVANALIVLLKEILILRNGGTVTRQGAALAVRQKLADAIGSGKVLAALSVLWDLKTKVRVGEDSRILADLAIVMLAERLHDAPKDPGKAAEPARKLSLAEMAAMR